ncbi:MAG: PilN domain-containing protein [Phycisphaerae bacterium]|nr:PilN domain-containing protein [Phycisphaerae bacterium]
MHPVNLVPNDCLEAQHRRARLKGWITVISAVGVLAVGCYAHYWMTRQAVRTLEDRLARVQATQSDLDRRVVQIQAESDATVAKAAALIGLQFDHPVPDQLRTLAVITPANVLLESLQTSAGGSAGNARGRPTPDSAAPGGMTLHVTGYAVEHGELEQLIEGIQRVPEWHRVDLVRAVTETYRGGELLAFELLCGSQEGRH